MPVEYASNTCWIETTELLLRPPEDFTGLRMAGCALAVEQKLDAGTKPSLLPSEEGDRAVLDLDHLTVDLREQRLNLIDEHT